MPTLQAEADRHNRDREKKHMADRVGDIMGLNGNTPWWVKALATIGVPACIAIYLVWFTTNGVMGAIQHHSESSEESNQIVVNLLTQDCVNGSETPDQENACFQVARGADPRRTR